MTDEPRNPEGQTPRSAAWHESLERFLSRNFWKLVGVSLIAVAVVMYFDVAIPTQPPRWARTVFWVAALGSPFAYVMASKVVDILYDPFGVVLLDLDARRKDVAIYNIPKKRWHEVTVLEGDVMRLEAEYTVYAGKNFDPDELTIEGTWRGSLSDYELVREQAKIAQLRGRLEAEAKRGFAIETHAWLIVRSATQDAVRSITETFEAGTLPKGGSAINDAIDDAIEAFEFGESLNDDLDEQDTPSEEIAEQVIDDVTQEAVADD